MLNIDYFPCHLPIFSLKRVKYRTVFTEKGRAHFTHTAVSLTVVGVALVTAGLVQGLDTKAIGDSR